MGTIIIVFCSQGQFSKGAQRQLAKLYLNNLYGKMATSTNRAAQANYHGVDVPCFIYADTDSIHCDLPPEQIKGISIYNTEYGLVAVENNRRFIGIELDEGYFNIAKERIEKAIIAKQKEDS